MSAANNPVPEVLSDTRLNVASLLMENVGATRDVAFAFESFPLDDDLTARDVSGDVRFTRLQNQLLASGRLTGVVTLECVRCLDEYDQEFEAKFTEFFRQSVDVRTGAAIKPEDFEDDLEEGDDDETGFGIDEAHHLDVGEAIRQWILLSLPMRPSCGANCRGPLLTSTDDGTQGDSRFAGLADLLDERDN
jgi:uncharacterized protein